VLKCSLVDKGEKEILLEIVKEKENIVNFIPKLVTLKLNVRWQGQVQWQSKVRMILKITFVATLP